MNDLDLLKWQRLRLSVFPGGLRWCLGGRPVHAGTLLDLRLPGDNSIRVRFGLEFPTGAPPHGVPVLFLTTGRDPSGAGVPEDDLDDGGPDMILRPTSAGWDEVDLGWPA